MYTFGQWIKIYRHLTMGGYPKKARPQQLLQTVNEHDTYRPGAQDGYSCEEGQHV